MKEEVLIMIGSSIEPEWRSLAEQKHGETAGRLFARIGLEAVGGLLEESLRNNKDFNSGMLKGFADSYSQRVFPSAQRDGSPLASLPDTNAQYEYRRGIQQALGEAIDAAKSRRSYQRLDISRFLGPRR